MTFESITCPDCGGLPNFPAPGCRRVIHTQFCEECGQGLRLRGTAYGLWRCENSECGKYQVVVTDPRPPNG